MMHRMLELALAAVCGMLLVGCSSKVHELLIRDELSMWADETIVEITLDNGAVIFFDDLGGHLDRKQTGQTAKTTVVGNTRSNERVQIDLEKVLDAKIERSEFSAGRTILFTLSILSGIFFTLLMIALSSI
ncbi:MAG: hypothetical protein WCI84_10755 [Bacteroidota bacterium]